MTGTEIQRQRQTKGWTQYELAKRAGVSQYVISKAENGGVVKTETMERIEGALAGKRYERTKHNRKNNILGSVNVPFGSEEQRQRLKKIWCRDYAPERSDA